MERKDGRVKDKVAARALVSVNALLTVEVGVI